MESEHLLLLIDIKQIFQLSQSRGCWKLEELKNVGILYEGLCNIIEHYEKPKEETHGSIETIVEQVEDNNEEIKEEQADQPVDKKLDESVEQVKEMEEID